MTKSKKSFDRNALSIRRRILVSSILPFGAPAGVAIIIVTAFLAYFPVLSGGFLLDDDVYVTNNRFINASDGLYWYWFTTEPSDYYPVTNTTFWIEWRLWGINPAGYHVTNLVLHIVESLLIWLILRRLSIPGAFLAGMIFAVHPVNVESVAWIAQRKNLMAMLFLLLSILCYLKLEIHLPLYNKDFYRNPSSLIPHPSSFFYWLSLAAFVLAMLSKGSAAVLPVLLLVIIWWLRGLTKWDLLRTAPFLIIAGVLTEVNVWTQTHGSGAVLRTAGFTERLLGAGGVVWFYLYKAFLPVDLYFIYPQWHIQVGNILWWLPLLAVFILTAVLWRYRESWSRPFLFAWLFFCVALVPVMGFVDAGFMHFSLVADHYQHIAIIGIIALTAAGWSIWHERTQGKARRTMAAIAVVTAGTLAFLTWRQSGIYHDAITLYQATLKNNSNCWMAHNNLGNVLTNAGRPEEAIEHYRQALQLKPDFPEAYNNLGNALVETGRVQEAIDNFRHAIRLNPDYSEACYNLGNTLVKTLRPQEAIILYRQALQHKPSYPEAHNNLGLALTNTGRPEEAIEHFEQALRLKPDFPDAQNNFGNALFHAHRVQEAIEHYRQALELKPDYIEAYNNLGAALVKADRPEEAISSFMQALRVKPDSLDACYNLAIVYAQINQSAQAIAMAQKAIDIARSQGRSEPARQIEDWLNSYRAGLSDLPNTQPSSETVPLQP